MNNQTNKYDLRSLMAGRQAPTRMNVAPTNRFDDEYQVDVPFVPQRSTQASSNFQGSHEDDLQPRITQDSSSSQSSGQDDVQADDSISQIGSRSQVSRHSRRSNASSHSRSSTMSNIMLKNYSRKAELLVEADAQQAKEVLENEELQLKNKREKLRIQTELAKIQAVEEICDKLDEERSLSSSRFSPNKNVTSVTFSSRRQSQPPPQPRAAAQLPPNSPPPQRYVPPVIQDSGPAQRVMDNDSQNNLYLHLLKEQQKSTAASRLPTRKLSQFDGDPLKYKSFIQAFDKVIVSKESDPQELLYYLIQYTSGPVKQLMESCQHGDAEKGYKKARNLLEQKYGQDFQVTLAYINSVVEGNRIKNNDHAALNQFALSLDSCRNTLLGLDQAEKLNNSQVLTKLAERFPDNLWDDWLQVVDKIMYDDHKEVTIDDLTSFIEKKVRQADNPLFGVKARSMSQKKTSIDSKFKSAPPQRRTAKVFATAGANPDNPSTSESFNKKCILCGNLHFLNKCKNFRSMHVADRRNYVKDNKLCFSCLNPSHVSKNCERVKPCLKCHKMHTTLLHDDNLPNLNDSNSVDNFSNDNDVGTDSPNQINDQNVISTACDALEQNSNVTLLPIVPVKLFNPINDKSIVINALLDNGSNTTFCSNFVVNKLNLIGVKTKISMSTLTKQNDKVETKLIKNLILSDIYDNNCFKIPQLYTRDKLPVTKESIPSQNDIENWPYLQNVNLPNINNSTVDLIIGNDMPFVLEPVEVISSQNGGPFAVKTKLGAWAINGPSSRKLINETQNSFFVSSQVNLMCKMCTDIVSDIDNGKMENSQDQKRFMENAKNTIKLKDGHYEVGLPIKSDKIILPNNESMALQRMNYLQKRFLRDKKYHADYTDCMESMIEAGYAQIIPDDKLTENNNKTWYIPHSGVRHPRKPEKIRVVYDCSAKYQGISLNDILLTGPDLTNTLVGVLLRFRQDEVAVMADIAKMFHQVRVPEDDSDYLRFFWWPQGDVSKPMQKYKMTVYPFGTVCSPSTVNYAVHQTAYDFKDKYSNEACEILLTNMYVDDLLLSCKSADKAIKLSKEVCELFNETGFKLTKWISNEPKVLSKIPEDERALDIESLSLNLGNDSSVKSALGVKWCVKSDTLGFSVDPPIKPLTRRGVLSTANSIWDPLGFTVPIMLPIKFLLRNLCSLELGWDDEMPDDCKLLWENWFDELPQLNDFKISRCLKPKDFGAIKSAQVHHFSDSSTKAMASVSYIKLTNNNDDVNCNLLHARSRLTPKKNVSIPRLELTAATMSVKNDELLQKELQIPLSPSVFWCDSTTVLFYLRNESSSFHTFVSNRVELIRNKTNNDQWKYVGTKDNVADIATRGMKIDKFIACKEWINGPEFIKYNENLWPTQPDYLNIKNELTNDVEIKSKVVMSNTVNEKPDSTIIDDLMQRYSDWNKLKRITSWILRYKYKLLNRVRQKQALTKLIVTSNVIKTNVDLLTIEEIDNAELEIIKFCQQNIYSNEINALQNGKKIKQSSSIIKLNPVLINGVLRIGGRLDKAPTLSFDEKHQIILSNKMYISELLAKDCHERCAHSGREYTLSLIRRKYWITKGNACVRKCLNACLKCRKNFRPAEKQIMSQLPADRITPNEAPFTRVGIDYFGPFYIKRARSQVKRYGVIFTCLVLRAVHLEVASDLSTDSFILALRRFIARRGPVKVFRSDNGTNFVGGLNELQKSINEWNQAKINDFAIQNNIKWIFNPPYASHHGAAWERLIRSVRKILMSLTNMQNLDDEGLKTLMCECESIVNGRPLTTVSCDSTDLNPLTPNHLLLLQSNNLPPPGVFVKEDLYSRKRWKQIQFLTNCFWKRWTSEYLCLLQQRNKWTTEKQNIKIGDIVLVFDENLPRNFWALGRIIDTFPDSKGMVRKVQIKTQKSVILRPISKICLLYGEDNSGNE